MTIDNYFHLVLEEEDFNVKADMSNDGGVSFKDVYHVLCLNKNLTSVSQLVDSIRYVIFGPNDV